VRQRAIGQQEQDDPAGRGDPRSPAARLAALVEIGVLLAERSSHEPLLQVLTDTARRVLGAERAELVMRGGGPSVRLVRSPPVGAAAAGDAEGLGARLAEALAADGRPLRTPAPPDDARAGLLPPALAAAPFLAVPVVMRQAVLGCLWVAGGDRPHDDDDVDVARALAAHAAAALDGAQRLALEHHRVEELEVLQLAVRTVQAVLAAGVGGDRGLDAMLPAVAARIRPLCGAELVAVAVVEDDRLRVRSADGARAAALSGLVTDPSAAALAAAVQERTAVPWVKTIPLRAGGQLVGVLLAAGERSEAGEAVRAVLGAIGAQVAIAIVNERVIVAERDRLAAAGALQVATERERATAEGFRRAIRAQEAERARIARELHDEAGQVLSAVALHLRALADGMDAEERVVLEDLRQAVNEASASLYELITELRPAALRKHGLAAAVTHQAARTAQVSGVDVRVAVDALPGDLPEETQTALFRVVQEALTNVSRHSGARHAAVIADRDGDRLRLVIEDDGRGFDAAAPSERHGLVGIRERVELLGGRLQVESAPGRGTRVAVEIGVGEGSPFTR